MRTSPYIAQDDDSAAAHVVSAFMEMSFTLADNPFLGTDINPLRQTLKGIRMVPVMPYRNHLISYRPLPDNSGVRILYALHAARGAAAFAREHRRN